MENTAEATNQDDSIKLVSLKDFLDAPRLVSRDEVFGTQEERIMTPPSDLGKSRAFSPI